MAIQARETRKGERRVVVRFDDDEIAESRTADLDRPQFMLHIDSWADNSRPAIVPLASVKRIVLERDRVTAPIPDDVVRKVALHFWDGEVVPGLLRAVPHRQRHGMVVELVSPQAGCAEVLRC